MNAIVVDDEFLLLEQFRYECGDIPNLNVLDYFDSPTDALDFAKEHPVELAFVDIMMPEMDGVELAAQLRGLYPDIRIIAMTAHDQNGRATAAKMDAIVLKPYERKDVEKALYGIL